MSSLDVIEVKGFKSIREMEPLKLGSLNVLIGANGAGKTNFVSVFKLLNQIVEGNLQDFVIKSGGANALLYFGQKVTSEINLSLRFGLNGYDVKLASSVDDTLFFSSESCWYQRQVYGDTPYPVSLGVGHKESKLKERGSRQSPEWEKVAYFVWKSMSSWKAYHFHDTSETAKVKLFGNIDDNAILRSDASNLAAFLYLLQERRSEHYNLIIETIRLAAPFFDDFVLRPQPKNPDLIKLEWHEKGSDSYFGAHALSDGTLRFICLATLLLQPNLPSTILIDEPELGLHPYAITLLASLLQSAATKTQVIVSTQSVPLVNQFSPENIIVVDREDGQSVFRHLERSEIENWLDEYGLGDLWEKNILGGRP